MLFLLRNDGKIILEFNHSTELSGDHPPGPSEPFPHPAMLRGELHDFGEDQQMRAAAPPS